MPADYAVFDSIIQKLIEKTSKNRQVPREIYTAQIDATWSHTPQRAAKRKLRLLVSIWDGQK
jgi:hypothetical protein